MAPSESATVEGESAAPKRVSCIPSFDALWFCYSPVYQLREYYVEGQLDDCSQHWKNFWDCLQQKTRFKSEETDPKASVHALWELRTPEEAAQRWAAEFGSGSGPEEEPLVT